jgi:hypothetical protein
MRKRRASKPCSVAPKRSPSHPIPSQVAKVLSQNRPQRCCPPSRPRPPPPPANKAITPPAGAAKFALCQSRHAVPIRYASQQYTPHLTGAPARAAAAGPLAVQWAARRRPRRRLLVHYSVKSLRKPGGWRPNSCVRHQTWDGFRMASPRAGPADGRLCTATQGQAAVSQTGCALPEPCDELTRLCTCHSRRSRCAGGTGPG